jgi:histidinol-phosphate aminotransferase
MARLSRRDLLQSYSVVFAGQALGVATAETPAAGVARLNHNENPFGPSPRARDALRSLGQVAWKYAYEEVAMLRGLVAEREGVRPANVFVGEGSGELLKVAAMLYSEPGREIIAARPTFPMLPGYAARHGAAVTWVDVDASFGNDFRAMRAKVSERTSLIYVCNPNNPTGTVADPDDLRAFIRAVSRGVCVVVDEAYIDFAANPERATVVDLVKEGANVLVTRTFSKLYGLAGLRIGYGIASDDVVRRLESLRISIPNQAGVTAARASLGDDVFRLATRKKVSECLHFTCGLFDELGLRYVRSQANFMMFDTRAPSAEFVDFALRRGVMIAPVQGQFGNWARVSMGRTEDMQSFARALRAYLKAA